MGQSHHSRNVHFIWSIAEDELRGALPQKWLPNPVKSENSWLIKVAL